MKKTLIALALAATSSVTFAQTPPQPPVPGDAPHIVEHLMPPGGLDPWHFCYFAGQPYSEGAKVAGTVCGEKSGIRVVDNNLDEKKDPLVWLTPDDIKKRM
jgi:hypothetical protein